MTSAIESFLSLQKWINSDLLLLNCTVFSSVYLKTVFITSYSTFAVSSAVFLVVYSVTSLI